MSSTPWRYSFVYCCPCKGKRHCSRNEHAGHWNLRTVVVSKLCLPSCCDYTQNYYFLLTQWLVCIRRKTFTHFLFHATSDNTVPYNLAPLKFLRLHSLSFARVFVVYCPTYSYDGSRFHSVLSEEYLKMPKKADRKSRITRYFRSSGMLRSVGC